MISLSDIIDYCRAESLASKFYPTETSDWRWFCREYSKTFHTPLPQVLEMDPEHVILCVLEEGLDNKRLKKKEDLDSLIEELRRLQDPDYDSTVVKEVDDWVSGIEEWEDERVAAGAPLPKKGQELPKELPKQGGINLSYLENSKDEQ